MVASPETGSLKLRLRRDTNAVAEWFRGQWPKRWFRLSVYGVGAFLFLTLVIWLTIARNLPSVDRLKTYEPPLPSYVRAIDGTPVHSYARERRVVLRYDEYPPLLIRAFLAAEDKNFFSHGGVEYLGVLAALWDNATSSGRPRGASTITQQVAKNLLLTNEATYSRKAKEALLAYRIESALTKQQILELYLNRLRWGGTASAFRLPHARISVRM